MSESLRDLDRLADRVRLHRQVRKRPVLVVEGRSDERLLSDLLGGAVDVFPAGSRDQALAALEELHGWAFDGVACVVDRDFDDTISDFESRGLAVFAYLNADQEAMLLDTPASSRLLAEYSNPQKLAAWGGAKALRAAILDVVVPIARLRRANAVNGWGLSFSSVHLGAFVEKGTLVLAKERYAARLDRVSMNGPGIDAMCDVLNGIGPFGSDPLCPRCGSRYFRGRDYLVVLAIGLRSAVGARRGVGDAELIEKALRLTGARALENHEWTGEVCEALGLANVSA